MAGDRDAVVAVADEVQLADAIDVDRRQRLAAAHRLGDALPAAAKPGGLGAELAIELALAIDRADDRVELDRLQPEALLAAVAERREHLVERKHETDLAGLAAQARAQARELLAPSSAAEIRLRVLLGVAGVHGSRLVRAAAPSFRRQRAG